VRTAGDLCLPVVNVLTRPPKDLLRNRPNPASGATALSPPVAGDNPRLGELPVSVARQVVVREVAVAVLPEMDRRVEPLWQFRYRNSVCLDHPGLGAVQRRVSVECLSVYLSGLG